MFTRRSILLGTVAVAALGAVGFRWGGGAQQTVLYLLRREFGDEIAAQPEALAFADEIVERVAAGEFRFTETDVLVEEFIRSTNVIRALETKDNLLFLGVGNKPGTAPCQNTLSVAWL